MVKSLTQEILWMTDTLLVLRLYSHVTLDIICLVLFMEFVHLVELWQFGPEKKQDAIEVMKREYSSSQQVHLINMCN